MTYQNKISAGNENPDSSILAMQIFIVIFFFFSRRQTFKFSNEKICLMSISIIQSGEGYYNLDSLNFKL